MRRLFLMVALAILLGALVLFGLSDAAVSTVANAIPNDEAVNSAGHAGNSSASATITITMTGVLDE